MNDIAIQVDNLSKRYRIGPQGGGRYQYKTLGDSLANLCTAPIGRNQECGTIARFL